MDQFEEGVTHTHDGFDAGSEGQQEDVEPGDKEAYRPADEDEGKEPDDGPHQARAQTAPSASASLTHDSADFLFQNSERQIIS